MDTGGSIHIKCNFQRVRWFFNHGKLPSNVVVMSMTSQIKIDDATASNDGTYICYGDHSYHHFVAFSVLNVYGNDNC